MCEMENCIFFMINYLLLHISFCQSAYQNLSLGNLTVPSINWWQQNWFMYLLMCMQKPWEEGEKLMENTHSKTNNRLFSLSLSTCFLPYSNHLKGKTAKTVLSTASPATAVATPHPPSTAHRGCRTAPLPRHRPPINLTLLGRKSQIHSKSGPSPGACMKADVSMKQVWLLRLRLWQLLCVYFLCEELNLVDFCWKCKASVC